MFTRIVNYARDGALDFKIGTPVEAIPMLTTAVSATTLRWLVDHLDVEQMTRDHQSGDYPAQMNAYHDARWASAEGGKPERVAVLTAERVSFFATFAQPAIRRAMLEDIGPVEFMQRCDDYRRRHGEGSAKRLGQMLRRCAPALEVSSQVFAGRQMQRARRTSQQDFWDMEHAASGFAYADAFVTLDRGLAALLQPPWMPPTARASLLPTMEELRGFLDRLVAAGSEPPVRRSQQP
jgi:hypothetical protein